LLDAARAIRLRTAATMRERDPLAFWHHSSDVHREATRFANKALVHFRAPNVSGKTEWGAALMLAAMRGMEELDGEPVPQLHKRAQVVVGSLDYQQQKGSVQAAYLRLLGEVPHKLTWKGDGILSTLRVKHRDSVADPQNWPCAHFISQENPHAGVGFRADGFHLDEPPKMSFLQELMKAPHVGRTTLRIITDTPLVRQQWAPLKEYFKDCYGVCRGGRVEVHLDDLTKCRHITPAHYRMLLDAYAGDPLREARLTAAYVDVTGSSPWSELLPVLDAMIAEAIDPDLVKWEVKREVDGEKGRAKVVETVVVEVHVPPSKVRRAYIVIDPSQGIDDKMHDPGGLGVFCRDTGDLLARYNGYIGAYGLGVLAAGLGRQYHDAVVDPETQGGWGGPVLTALHECGYGNIAQQRIETMPGRWETRLGFRTTTETRPAMFSAIREWLLAHRAGMPYARVLSRPMLECLRELTLDAKGKPLAAPGLHDEDAILLGQALRVLRIKPNARVVLPVTKTADGHRVPAFLRQRVGDRLPPRPAIRPRAMR